MDDKTRVYLTLGVGVVMLFYSTLGFEETNNPFMVIGFFLIAIGAVQYTKLNNTKNNRRR